LAASSSSSLASFLAKAFFGGAGKVAAEHAWWIGAKVKTIDVVGGIAADGCKVL